MAEQKAESSKKRRTMTPKPYFVVLQVLDANGQPTEFDKDRINIVVATKDAGKALEVMDGGEYAHATYKKVDVA